MLGLLDSRERRGTSRQPRLAKNLEATVAENSLNYLNKIGLAQWVGAFDVNEAWVAHVMDDHLVDPEAPRLELRNLAARVDRRCLDKTVV